MIHIDRDGRRPDSNWIERANQLTKKLLEASNKDEIHTIIDKNENTWRKLKEFLLDISSDKCWYSESKDNYSYLHVDHFRPKKVALGIDKQDHGGYWWLAFDWKNYRVCGPVGNINKKDKFAVLKNKANSPNDNIEDEIIYFLDPTEEEDVLKITFNNVGEIMPIENNGWIFEQADYTIKNLKLNSKKLKESRKNIWVKCSNHINQTQTLMYQNNINPSPFRRAQIKEKIKQIKDLVKASSEFAATAKACLKSTGIDWTMKIEA